MEEWIIPTSEHIPLERMNMNIKNLFGAKNNGAQPITKMPHGEGEIMIEELLKQIGVSKKDIDEMCEGCPDKDTCKDKQNMPAGVGAIGLTKKDFEVVLVALMNATAERPDALSMISSIASGLLWEKINVTKEDAENLMYKFLDAAAQ